MTEPKTPAQRVRASEARKIKAGGRRLPGGVMSPDAAAAVDALIGAEYAGSVMACIERALVTAAKRRKLI
jgi:hypothetical protein